VKTCRGGAPADRAEDALGRVYVALRLELVDFTPQPFDLQAVPASSAGVICSLRVQSAKEDTTRGQPGASGQRLRSGAVPTHCAFEI